ncbi:MAG: hypothetical protein ABW277_26180 [Longimicrobiaceae bacterium]
MKTHSLRRTCLGLFALACLGAASGCTREPEDRYPRLDREAVGARANRAPKFLLLVFSPEDCLACATDMPRWLALRRHSPGSVAILLTRPPSAAQTKVFARYRIPVDGVLGRGAFPKPSRGGTAYLYVAGELAVSGPLNRAATQATLDKELAP